MERGAREKGEEEREVQRERKGESRSNLFRRRKKREHRLEEWDICSAWLKKGDGRGRSLSLKGTVYPGDRPGQQIITPSI